MLIKDNYHLISIFEKIIWWINRTLAKAKVKKKIQSKAESNKRIRISLANNLEHNHIGLIIYGFYLLVVGIISFVFHKVGDYGVETDFFLELRPECKGIPEWKYTYGCFPRSVISNNTWSFWFCIKWFFHAGMLMAIISAAIVDFVTFE